MLITWPPERGGLHPKGPGWANPSHPKITEVREVLRSLKFFDIGSMCRHRRAGRIAGCRSFHLPQGARTRLSGPILAPKTHRRRS
jgi:hypothetical protein